MLNILDTADCRFMMFQDGPFLMRERLDEDQRSNMLLPLGLVREFVVSYLPCRITICHGPCLISRRSCLCI